jgi:thiol-disulfide isomerase/thioredoxin
MDTAAALMVLTALIAGSAVLGLVWRRRNGRVTEVTGGGLAAAVTELDGVGPFGSGATLLQFSTEVCAPCHATRRVLAALAENTPGVHHLEVNVAQRPALATRFRVTQAPTTFLLDGSRTVRARIAGVPDVGALTARLAEILKEKQPHA